MLSIYIHIFDYFLFRSTIQRAKEELNTLLQTVSTHLSDPPMAMSHHMATAHMQVTPVTGITTTAMLQKIEDIPHPAMHTCKKVPKRREIETTNPLEISTQVRTSCSLYLICI